MKQIKSFIGFMLIVVFMFTVLTVLFAEFFIYHPERYSSVARYHLLISLEDGDKDALKYYRENYVVKGEYLFEGPLTFNIICELYSVEYVKCQEHYERFTVSDMNLKKYVYKNFR